MALAHPKQRIAVFVFTSLLLVGCDIPIPSSIGMMMTDEVEMSVKDLALASLFSELCGKSGFESENAAASRAVTQLSNSQRKEFDKWQGDRKYRREIKQSVNKKACTRHAKEFRRMESKKIVITG